MTSRLGMKKKSRTFFYSVNIHQSPQSEDNDCPMPATFQTALNYHFTLPLKVVTNEKGEASGAVLTIRC
jgi:hypothetical protein